MEGSVDEAVRVPAQRRLFLRNPRGGTLSDPVLSSLPLTPCLLQIRKQAAASKNLAVAKSRYATLTGERAAILAELATLNERLSAKDDALSLLATQMPGLQQAVADQNKAVNDLAAAAARIMSALALVSCRTPPHGAASPVTRLPPPPPPLCPPRSRPHTQLACAQPLIPSSRSPTLAGAGPGPGPPCA